jgi:hypothetical protein
MNRRYFVQLVIGGSGHRDDGKMAAACAALANDGTVWMLGVSADGPAWQRMPDCPQPPEGARD